jgi:hypothetical protein
MPQFVKLGKSMGALKVSKQPVVDHADRAHYDAVAPELPTGAPQRRSKGDHTKRKIDEDDAEIVIVEPKRRSADAHAYGRRAVVVSGRKVVGVQG